MYDPSALMSRWVVTFCVPVAPMFWPGSVSLYVALASLENVPAVSGSTVSSPLLLP